MNDYTALKLTHLRREQAARLQRNEDMETTLEQPVRRPLLPSLRLLLDRRLPRPLRPASHLPSTRVTGMANAASRPIHA